MATTRLQLGPADHGRKLTLEEFEDAECEDGFRYELAEGILEVSEVPNDPHWQVVSNLLELFFRYKEANPGRILRIGGGADCRILVPEMISGRHPDAAIVLVGTPKNARGRRPPSLVVEVVSEGGERRDYETKRQEYLVGGLSEYWIVDPNRRQVIILMRREDGGAARWEERLVGGDSTLAGVVLPAFEGTVSALWVDVEPQDDLAAG